MGIEILGGTRKTRTTVETPPVSPAGYPDASNAGVPAGTSLATGYNQSTGYGVASGTVILARDITCNAPMEHPAGDAGKTITYRNCRFTDGGVYWMVLGERGVKLVFDHCTFRGVGASNPANDAALNGSDITLIGCDIYNTGDGVKIGSRVVIQDTWIHALYVQAESHNDSVQSMGTAGNGAEGSGARIVHNTLDASNGATCITLSTGSAESMRDILVEDNLFACNGVSVTGGYDAGRDSLSKVSNIIYRNNKLKQGSHTPVFTSVDSPVVVSGTTWFDGPNAGLPAS